MKRMVLKIYDFLSSHRRALLPLLLAVIVLFAVLSSGMKPQEDITAFLPKQDGYARISEAYSNIRAANMQMVTVSPKDIGAVSEYRLMDAADSLIAALLLEDAGKRDFFPFCKCPSIHINHINLLIFVNLSRCCFCQIRTYCQLRITAGSSLHFCHISFSCHRNGRG